MPYASMPVGSPVARVVLADDHELVRAGLARLLNISGGIRVVGEAGTAWEAAELAIELDATLLLIDLNMPGGGLAAIAELNVRAPDVHILAVSMHEDVPFIRAALEAGADGYVVKSSAPSVLLQAIRSVCAGQGWWPVDLSGEPATPDLTLLSDREREVLKRVAAGLTSREIGEELGLSAKSVDTYRLRAGRKLGVASRAELGTLAELLRCGAGSRTTLPS